MNFINIRNKDEYENFLNNNTAAIIKIGAEWCGPCHVMDDTMAQIESTIPVGHIDVEDEGVDALIGELGVRNIPVTLFFKNGTIVERKVGLMQATEITENINKLIES